MVVLKIDNEEIVLEVSVEDSVIVAIMAGEDAVCKSTLEDLKQILKRERLRPANVSSKLNRPGIQIRK